MRSAIYLLMTTALLSLGHRASATSAAKTIQPATSQELPIGRNLPRETVAQNFAWLQDTSSEGGMLAFELLVPRAWRRDEVRNYGSVLNSQRMLPLAALASPSSDAYLEVQAVRLTREIRAEHWVRHYLRTERYQPQTVVGLSPAFADSLATFDIEGHRFRGRFAARLHGDVLFLISAFCTEPRYEAMADALGVAIASFRPIALPRRTAVEKRVTHRLPPDLSFEAPASWLPQPAGVRPDGSVSVDLVAKVAGEPLGVLWATSTEAVPTASLDQQRSTALAKAAASGLRIGELRDSSAPDLTESRFREGKLAIYGAATPDGSAMELWVLTMRAPSRFITIGLLTPDRNDQYRIWAENRRSLDILLETIR